MRLLPLVCLLVTLPLLRSETAPAPAPLPPHPRLLATQADFDRIRNSITQPGPLRDAFLLVSETAGREYAEPPLSRKMVGRRLLGTSRDALRRILNFAMLYRLNGETRWAARAEREMLALAAFSDWNPPHFLDTAEAATAVAIGYDWIYDTLSPESRATLREALVTHALRPGDADGPGQNNWRRSNNNWKQVCETGLALAALVLDGDEPELAARAIERARRRVPAIFETYEPDGGYAEGTMYWDYGTTYHVLLIEALRTATGSAGSVATNAAFLRSASVLNLLTGPTGRYFNYGDSLERRSFMPAMYWFARETRNPAIVATEHLRMGPLHPEKTVSADVSFPTRFLALTLLWMPAGPPAEPVPLTDRWATRGTNPLALFRRGTGKDALFVAMKGGRARNSHAHMDAGSFVVDLGGVRWTADVGMPSYNQLETTGVDLFGKDRWKVYALGPYSHSIPLINDTPPDENATATLAAFSEPWQAAVFDLSPLYSSSAARLQRGLRIEGDTTFLIRDELEGAKPGARYRFSWMTRARVEIDATGATLHLGGKSLRLAVACDGPFTIVDEDVSHPPAPYDAPQPGLRRVSVLCTLEKPSLALEVRVTAGEASSPANKPGAPLRQWTAE